MRHTALSLVLAAAIAHPPTALADWPADGIVISDYSPCGHSGVRMFLEPITNDALIVYASHSCSGGLWWAVQRVHFDGTIVPGWGSRIDYVPDADPSGSQIALDGLGGILYTFKMGVNTPYDVWLDAVRWDGTLEPPHSGQGAGWPIASSNYSGYPGVVGDGAGGALVAWTSSPDGVVVRHVLHDGSFDPAWPADPVPLETDATLLQFYVNPGMLADGSGGVFVAWVDSRARVMLLNGDGSYAPGWPVGGLALNTAQPRSPVLIRLLPGNASSVYALWIDQPTAPNNSARWTLQHFSRGGVRDSRWPAGGLVLLNSTVNLDPPVFVGDGSGGVLLAWENVGSPYLLHVLGNGQIAPGYPPGGLSPLDAGAHYVGGLAAATSPDSGIMVGWRDTRQSRPGYRVRWLRNDGTPDPVAPDTGLVVLDDANGGQFWYPLALLGDGTGGAYFGWNYAEYQYDNYMRMSRVGPAITTGVGAPAAASAALELRSIVPNPASGSLAVRLVHDRPARLELFDLVGRRVRGLDLRGAGDELARFDHLGSLPAGLYLVRLAAPGARARTARVAIVH